MLSERLVRVELGRRVIVHELLTPGLLHLWTVGLPTRLGAVPADIRGRPMLARVTSASAPPSWARCRARHGRLACRQEGSLPRPPSSAWVMLYPSAAITAGCLGAHSAKALPLQPTPRTPHWQLSQGHRLCLAGPPCRGAQQGTNLFNLHRLDQSGIKTAPSPANKRGS